MPKTDSATKITILIADDHPMVREGLRSMLTAPDLTIIGEAGSGQEAVAQVKALRPDVVLMDIRMPDMDGIAALEALKEAQVLSRVIMVTTYRNTAFLLRALAAGADGFVLKDIPRNDLLATVRAVASGAARVDQQFLQQVLRDLAETQPLEAGETALLEPLTPREMDVLRLLVEGLTNQAIGHALGLSPGTVKGYVQTIVQKLNAADRTQAAVKAIRLGLVK
ncbi:MAG: response regulator transcription factor [Anaerolineae bacterium]|nr:response regulator transcription factor [Anaerolineales bacterium]MCQ3975725.1 DNA-binding response regulator [Anaerolineae bacterium]